MRISDWSQTCALPISPALHDFSVAVPLRRRTQLQFPCGPEDCLARPYHDLLYTAILARSCGFIRTRAEKSFMATSLFSHAACFANDTGEGHPERADRLRAALAGLEGEEFMYLARGEAPRATPHRTSKPLN